MNSKIALGGAILLVSLTHCSHEPAVAEMPPSADATDEVRKLNDDVSAAATRQVDVIDPEHFDKAQEALNEARHDLQTQQPKKDTLHEVSLGRAYLNTANRTFAFAQENMPEVLDARHQAVLAGAPELFDTDFRKLDDNLRSISSDLENGKTDTSQKYRTPFQKAYLDLELRSIKQTNLGPARSKIAKAIQNGAKDYTPKTLTVAEQSLKDTDAFITANRHDPQVKTRSEVTDQTADHLLKILADAKAAKTSSPEQTALQMDQQEDQVIAKDSQLQSEQSQLETEQQRLLREKQQSEQLAQTNEGLTAEQSFNKRFDLARSQFSQDEAEVYRQGDNLVIRLKSLEFPKSQANLKGSNFPLLAKVQKVIQGFQGSSVVIQGNTDSTGGREKNLQLSEQRAQAVRDYLVANNAISADKIKAVGNGDEQPLASNKTAAGRAENRRVDVVIQPQAPEQQS